MVVSPDIQNNLNIATQNSPVELFHQNDDEKHYNTALIHELWEAQVQQTPDTIAVEFAGNNISYKISYQELNQRANQLAHHLQSLGVGADVIVGICVERSIEQIIAIIATLKAGGAYLPLDSNYPSERLAFMLENSQASIVLTQSHLSHNLPSAHHLHLDIQQLDTYPTTNPQSQTTPDNLAYVIYTSGSTGQPKGVAMTHRPLVNLITWQSQASTINPHSRTLQYTPISFDVSFQETFATLTTGGTLVLITDEIRRHPHSLCQFLQHQGIERLFLPFVALQQLAEIVQLEDIIPTSLQEIITAGEQLRITEAIAHLFTQLPHCTLHNHYGPSETHVVTSYILTGSPSDWQVLPPIGKPIANSQIYLLDAQLQPVGVGVVGELYVGGVSLAQGYLHRPDLTNQRFITTGTGERLYKTGDLARYLPDGNLEYLGRADQQVKIRGYRIEPGEVEAVLEGHSQVRQAVVVARADMSVERRLVAYLLADKVIFEGELRQFLQLRLPDYMIPSAFVFLDHFPLTPSGKVDRHALPAPSYTINPENLIAPQTPTQIALADIWTDILGTSQIGIHDNFFDLGGHSLLVTRTVARMRAAFQVELPLGSLFTAPAIAPLAELIEALQKAHSPQMPRIEPLPRHNNLPLSFVQEQLWFLDQLVPNHPFYNVPEAFRLQGALNVTYLEQAFQAIIQRHEVLRTSFINVDGNPVQVIHPTCHWQLSVVELEQLLPQQRESAAWQLILAAARQPFDLSQIPLFQVKLYQLNPLEHILFLNLHHIICDEWSISILLQELSQLYVAYGSATVAPLPELQIQSADYANWQRQWLQTEVRAEQLAYWQNQLAALPPPLQLPIDRPYPAVPTYQGDRQYFHLPLSLSQNLKQLSRQTGVTLFVTMLTALQTLLYLYTRQEDILVGSPIANRHHPETERAIGFFINTVVLRTDLSGNPSFRELLHRVQAATLGAYTHQDLPFEQVVQAVQPDRDSKQNPLFQVLFNFQTEPIHTWEVPELSLTRLPVNNHTAKFDLFLQLIDTATGMTGFLEYSTDVFASGTISRLVDHFQALLAGIDTHPDQQIADLSLLTDMERQQLWLWNQTQTDYPLMSCVHQLWETQVERTPNQTAIEFAGENISYAELNQRANQLAHYLQSLGVGADEIVGICVERSPEQIIAIIATLKAGGAYLPLDSNYPPERLAFMVENSQASIVLTQSHLSRNLPSPHHIHLDVQQLDTYPITNPPTTTNPDNLAYVIYTSGSTGQPKGVAMTHRPLVNLITWQSQASTINPHSRTLQYTPISFDVSFQETFATLTTGGTLVLITDEIRRHPSSLCQFLQHQGIQRLFLPFVALQQLAEVVQLEGIIPTSLQEIITAGEQLRITEAIAHLFAQLPNCTLHNHYGPSETHVVTSYTLTGSPSDWQVLPPIGKAIANSKIHLLDAQLQPVAVGVVGELYVGGVSLAQGYLHRPDLTNQRFITTASGERLYKTGDLARYLCDGNLEYLGRADQQVKIRGYRIEPGEVEAVLEGHSQVRQAVVVARGDISGERRLVAYLLADQVISECELRQFLQLRLPDYMIPSAFVFLPNFPLTPSGKVDRHALPAPQDSRPELLVNFAPPRTKIEELLVSLWCQNLGISQVGIHDNFFELGGYSLTTVKLVAKIQKTLQVNLSVRSFFEAPTIAQIAELIADEQAGQQTLSLINPAVDFHTEAVLDPTIYPSVSTQILDEPVNILLTGATGFLGGFLLHELLTQFPANIYCLTRAKNIAEGNWRLKNNLQKYSLWDDHNSHRIIPVVGNLAKPHLGLSSQEFANLSTKIDVIYHNGGLVNFIYPYSVLKAPNVLGTQEILRLASQTKIKPVHFISTVGVFSPTAYPETEIILEQEANRPQGLYGYTQSKWVAEKLVNIAHERGIPTSIYRPTWIEGHSQTGICNNSDFLRNLIKGCIQLGFAPDWQMPVDIIPVDYISQAIAYLSRQKSPTQRIFHLSNPNSISWHQLVAWMQKFGYPLQQIPVEDWLSKVMFIIPKQPENALHPFLNFLSDKVSEQKSVPENYFQSKLLKYNCQNTLDGLKTTNIICPAVDDQLLHTYFSYFIQTGFLEPPAIKLSK